MEIPLIMGIKIALIAFFAEYFDSALGMGYGTLLTPLLLLMGFKPMEGIPSVLLSEFITGLLAGFTHHSLGNVNLRPKTISLIFIIRKIRELGFRRSFEKGVPIHLKIALLLGVCSIVGTIIAALTAVRLSKFWLTMSIGCIITVMGGLILLSINRTYKFSWKKLTILGMIASFNKGMSAGGYGPIVTGGQLLSGVETKSTVGITSLAEGLTCLVGIIMYFISVPQLNLGIAPYNVVGAVLSVPFAALTVKSTNPKKMKLVIGIITLILGILTIGNLAKP